jgi:hypothetical protein
VRIPRIMRCHRLCAFTAQYDGRCHVCQEDIAVGVDRIRRDEAGTGAMRDVCPVASMVDNTSSRPGKTRKAKKPACHVRPGRMTILPLGRDGWKHRQNVPVPGPCKGFYGPEPLSA